MDQFNEDNYVDVTDSVVVYEQGKVVECECGHGIGVEKDTRAVRCAKCGKTIIDHDYRERDEPTYKGGQTELEDWL